MNLFRSSFAKVKIWHRFCLLTKMAAKSAISEVHFFYLPSTGWSSRAPLRAARGDLRLRRESRPIGRERNTQGCGVTVTSNAVLSKSPSLRDRETVEGLRTLLIPKSAREGRRDVDGHRTHRDSARGVQRLSEGALRERVRCLFLLIGLRKPRGSTKAAPTRLCRVGGFRQSTADRHTL